MRAFYPPARIGFLRVYPRSPALRIKALARGPIFLCPGIRQPVLRPVFCHCFLYNKRAVLETGDHSQAPETSSSGRQTRRDEQSHRADVSQRW